MKKRSPPLKKVLEGCDKVFLFKKAKKRPVLKSKAREDILKRLDSYLEEESQLPIEILHGFWKDQQQALTYQEIREWFKNGVIDENTWEAWQQDYSILITQRLRENIWKQAIVAGTMGQKMFFELEKRGFKADLVSEKINNYIENRSTALITRVTTEQREAIRTLLMQVINEGQSSEEFAKVIRPIVGLDKRQAIANMKYYNNVKANLITENPRMKTENAEKRAREASLKYAEKQHRYRAQRIAQTEMAFAYNFGADEAAEQAYQRGFLGKFKRIWCSAGGKEVCEDCQNLDGNEIENDILPPKHPNCRCAVQYIEREKPKRIPDVSTPQKVQFLQVAGEDLLTEDRKNAFEEEIALIPDKHKAIIESSITKLQIIQDGNSCVDRNTGIMYLRYDFEKGEAIHEFGHIIETQFGVWTGTKFVDCIKETLDYVDFEHCLWDEETFVKGIYRINLEDRLLSIYQGRAYEEVGLVDDNFEFNYYSLGDFFSEAYKYYFIDRQRVMKVQPSIYEYLKELIEE